MTIACFNVNIKKNAIVDLNKTLKTVQTEKKTTGKVNKMLGNKKNLWMTLKLAKLNIGYMSLTFKQFPGLIKVLRKQNLGKRHPKIKTVSFFRGKYGLFDHEHEAKQQ